MPIAPAIVGVDTTTSQFNLRYQDPLSANVSDEIRINPTAKTIHAYDYSVFVKDIFGNVGANISTSNLTVDTLNANLIQTEHLIANTANIETLWTNLQYSNTIYVGTISADNYIGVPSATNHFDELYANTFSTDGQNSEISVHSKFSVDGAIVSLDTAKAPGAPGATDTHLAMYGDGAGGAKPYRSLAFGLTYPGYKMFTQYDGASVNQLMYKKQNLQYNSTDPLIGNDPAWEYRDYSDMNCKKVSSILCDTTGVPIDNPVCTWEWKYHRDIDTDGQPETNKRAINEQNKIAHIIRQPDAACITEIAMATNPSAPNGSKDTNFRFTPDVPNEPLLPPLGTMEMNIGGTKIWDADKTDMIVYLTNDTYNALGVRDITNSSFQTRGGLWVKKKAFIGDILELRSNLAGTAIQFYNSKMDPVNLIPGTSLSYSTSNTLAYNIPASLSGTGATTPFEISINSVRLGDGAGTSVSSVSLQTSQRSRIDLGDNIEINPNAVNDKTVKVFGSNSSNPLIETINEKITLDSSNILVYSNTTNYPIINVTSDSIVFGESSKDFDTDFKLYSDTSGGFTFVQDADSITLGHSQIVMNTTPLSTIYANSPSSANNLSMWQYTGDGTVGNYRVMTNELVRPEAVPGPPTPTTGTLFTINPDSTNYTGFRVYNTQGDAFTVAGPTAALGFSALTVRSGMGINFAEGTTTELTNGTFQSRVAKSFVFDTTKNTLGFYTGSPFTSLKYLVSSDSGNTGELVTYDSFSSLATNFSNTTTGNIAYVSLQTSNLSGNTVSQPYPEYRPTTTVKAPIISLGDGFARALLSTHLYECRGKFKDNLNSTTPTYSDTSVMRWNWQSSGAQYLWFQLAYAQAGNPATFPDSDSTQGRLFAPMDGWITSVTIKFYASGLLEQGGGGGYINTYKQFMGFYLGKGTRGTAGNEGPGWPYAQTSDLKQFFKPTCVYRYLGYYQVGSLTPGDDVSIPATMRFDLPLEDWVYVEQGEVMPYVSMVCPLTAGAGGAPDGPGTFKISSNNSDDNADTITATVTFSALPPRVAESRGDVRWDTGMAAAFGGQPIDPVCG